MNLARITVPRPVLTIMGALIVITLGGIALSRLPIDLMPELTYPTISVLTNYTNAAPEEVEELITRPVEGTVAAVPGVETITSVSTEGISTVRVSFTWGTDLDVAANDMRDRLDRIATVLPDEVERPRLFKFDAATYPVLILGVSSALDPIELRQLIDEQMKYRLERIPGVAVVDVFGGLQREVQVRLDPERVRALQLPLDQVLAEIAKANVSLPAGEIRRGLHEVTLRTPGRFTDLDQLRNTVVAVREGTPILLGQIADVRDTHAKVTRIERVNGKPGVRMGVRKQSTANTVEVARRGLREVERLNVDFPQVEIVPLIDSSQYIVRSIANIGQTILYGGLLAALVLLFFLRDLRSTLVVTTAIPISLIATFTLIYFGGFTLNIMTLGGLSLGVGMMVDNAIVVLENIVRRREAGGQAPGESAIRATSQVALAITASTLTTLAVFLPLFFFRGLTGVLFKQMAYVVSFALGCSLLVALSLVPMLAARLARAPGDPTQARTRFGRLVLGGAQRGFATLETGYGRLLAGVLRHRPSVLLGTGVLLAGMLALVPGLGTEFMPKADESEVRVNVEMEPGTRMDVLERQMLHVERIVAESIPEKESYFLRSGGSFFRPSPATGEIRVYLVPASERTRSSEQIASDLRRKLRDVAGAVVRTRAGSGLFVLRLGASADEQLQIEVRGFDLDVLDGLAAQVRTAIQDLPGITDVQLSREAGVPQQLVHVDRQRAADLGVSVSAVAGLLETAVAGSTAGTFRAGGQEPNIRVQLKDAERLRLEDVLGLTMTNARGEPVVLRNLVRSESGRGPIQILRINQQRVTVVSANIAGRDLGHVVADVRERLGSIVMPRGYEATVTGDYEEQQKAFAELMFGFVLALALVYMILASLYESLRDPLVVMCTVPLGAIGVIAALWLTGTTFNVQSFIGSIMLVGIVVNNAILIVDRTNQLRAEDGLSPREAVVAAGRERLRPILMTSLTTVCALLPLAIGIGEGAEAQAPMARAVVGGLSSATFVTLLVIPAVYTLFHPEHRGAPAGATLPQPAGAGDRAELPAAGK